LVRSATFVAPVVELLGQGSSTRSPVVDLRFEPFDDRLELVLSPERHLVGITGAFEITAEPGELSISLRSSFVFGTEFRSEPFGLRMVCCKAIAVGALPLGLRAPFAGTAATWPLWSRRFRRRIEARSIGIWAGERQGILRPSASSSHGLRISGRDETPSAHLW
jgi:hypothetical protein